MRGVRPTGGHPRARGDLGRPDPKAGPRQRTLEGLRGQTSPTWARAERAPWGSGAPPAAGRPAALREGPCDHSWTVPQI